MLNSRFKRIQFEDRDGVVVVHLRDTRLSETLLVTELSEELKALIEEIQPKHLVLDFKQVTHCSTSVISAILRTKKLLSDFDGKMKLCGMNATIREAYSMLNLDGPVFSIHTDADSAIAAF